MELKHSIPKNIVFTTSRDGEATLKVGEGGGCFISVTLYNFQKNVGGEGACSTRPDFRPVILSV